VIPWLLLLAAAFTLSEALKRGPVVVYFYPKSFTSVCTEEAHLFAEAMSEFEALGSSVIGISTDTIETQREFSRMECRDKFPVAGDPDGNVVKAYNVLIRIEGVGIIATHNPGVFEWGTFLYLLLLGIVPGILFYIFVIRPERYEVALCDVHGGTDMIIFHTTKREQADEICRTLSDATGLYYKPVM